MLKIISSEHMFLLEYLLVYLIFGASEIHQNVFVFDNHRTPKEHVSVLLENFVTQFSNLIIYKLLKNFVPLTSAVYFINNNNLCNSVYISMRSIALFFNTLTVERFTYLYFNKPKQICNSRYKVSIISSSGLVAKYIYLFRSNDISCLSRFQLFVLFLIEIQDILIPQLEKFILILSKITFYVLVNFLGNSAIFCIRSILSGINTLQK
uniref:hypothetical protein Ycf55 n=1 Tax=Gloiopeltis furcata TaxID=42017 RepID=UPI0028D154D3|nr:hypothetical protein Ycf55 [Gloiopeltis furcata]WMP13998.1 hypothetical protein Ycf55 [Gloiopeltis furcata]